MPTIKRRKNRQVSLREGFGMRSEEGPEKKARISKANSRKMLKSNQQGSQRIEVGTNTRGKEEDTYRVTII